MDKKTFNKITKEIFVEYGFNKVKNKFILQLKDISITVRLESWRGVLCFVYNFGINELYDELTPLEKRYDSLVAIKMEHDESAEGYHKHEILYETYTEEEYKRLLEKLLHKYFDAYKEDALNYLRENDYCMILSKKARLYLGLEK